MNGLFFLASSDEANVRQMCRTQCGKDGAAPDPCPTGYIDNVAIWNGWASSRDHKQYNAAVTVPAQKFYPKINVNNVR